MRGYTHDEEVRLAQPLGALAPKTLHVLTDVYGLGATWHAVSADLAPELLPLIARMTGLPDSRPRDMAEVARLLADIARQHGLESTEMLRDQPLEPEKSVQRGLLSAIASLFKGRPSS